jgi:signal peptide peptidase SppA
MRNDNVSSKVSFLAYLANRPYWAMLRSSVEQFYTRLSLELAEGISEGDVTDSLALLKDEQKEAALAVVAERFASFSSAAPSATKIAVIPIQGSLGNDSFWSDTTYAFLQDAVEKAANNPEIGEIILLVDSPGGEVAGLPETADVINAATKVKTVTAVVSGIAASAAYWLASQATSIVLTPSGEVGSVGVLMVHADITKMLDKAGVKLTPISAGKYKTEFFPFTPLTEEAQKSAQEGIDALYGQFLSTIARGRGSRVTAEMKANNYGDGRMLSASDAYNGGLVDKVASVRELFKERTTRARLISQLKGLDLV